MSAPARPKPESPGARREGGPASDPILEARGISVRFGGFKAVNDVDITVERGAIHAILGPNGAGKTTLFNALSGLVPLAGGTIRFDGRQIESVPVSRRAHLGFARSFQISNLYADLPVRENVRLALQAMRGARAFDFLSFTARQADLLGKADRLLQEVALAGKAGSPAAELSHGEQRRLEIALALAGDPSILFLDEPTAGMGIDDIAFTKQLILDLVARKGVSVVLIEHNMPLVMDISDRITVLQQGEKIAEGDPQAIRADPVVRMAYLGE